MVNGNYTLVHTDTLFHIHTFRCKHASFDTDEAYVKKAVELGYSKIAFTDHAPFPCNSLGERFGSRMDFAELPEYIASLKQLKQSYAGLIDVQIGLELEYLPSFLDFYKELYANPDIEWLILGQHFFEHSSGVYSFSDGPLEKEHHYIGLCQAMIDGMNTGLFRVLAHPDRVFRFHWWDEDTSFWAEKVIRAALETNTILENNLTSMLHHNYYKPEFWDLLKNNLSKELSLSAEVIEGFDAHSVEAVEQLYRFSHSQG